MKVLSSFDLKILSFLREVGQPVSDTAAPTLQLVRFFEQEYGCNLLGLLEKEWWAEQVHRDVEEGPFREMRAALGEADREHFDEVVEMIFYRDTEGTHGPAAQ